MSRGKKDANQDAFVSQLRQLGFDVDILSQYRGHPYDLVVTGIHPHCAFPVSLRVEIKMRGAKLTPRERLAREKGLYPVLMAYALDDILRWFQRF